jgi:hypothetical protein
VFDVPKSVAAFYLLLESYKGKKAVTKIIFEAYLVNGEPVKFKATEVKVEERVSNLLLMRSKKKDVG